MSHYCWDKSLETGIESIDRQHLRIIDYINQLDDAIATDDRDEVAEVLDSLIDYTVTHFRFEERIMASIGYDDLIAHKEIHDTFARSIFDYRERFLKGDDIARDLRSGLIIWLVQHIKHDDRQYVMHCERAAKSGDGGNVS